MLWKLEHEDRVYENYYTIGVYSTLEKAQQGFRDVLEKITWDKDMFFRLYAETVQRSINCTVIVPLPIDDQRPEPEHFALAEEATRLVVLKLQDLYAEAYNCNPEDYGHHLLSGRH